MKEAGSGMHHGGMDRESVRARVVDAYEQGPDAVVALVVTLMSELVAHLESVSARVMVLEGENAVAKNREVMGATDPAKAAAGTIRAEFAENIEANSVHGSDSAENAAVEIGYFFAGIELVG